jgi:ribonuclease HII
MDKLVYEKKYLDLGYKYIAGIDEVGRGPLAGPVVCAAVIMPFDDIIEGVDDSKKLSAKKRDELCKKILDKAISVKICEIENEEIDEINILNAVKKCMKMCIEGLNVKPDIILTDAIKIDTDILQENIIKGDYLSYTIGASSIVAKVYRDKLMEDYDELYPEYNFKSHKGYGTKLHIQKIMEEGPCKIHRKTFIKNFWENEAK